MYKNVLLDNLKIIDFFEMNGLSVKKLHSFNLGNQQIKFIAENLNSAMYRIIREDLLGKLIDHQDILKKILADQENIYIDLIDSDYSIEDIQKVLDTDTEVLKAMYDSFRKNHMLYGEDLKDYILMYCIDRKIVDCDLINQICEFASRYSVERLRKHDIVELLNFVIEYDLLSLDTEFINRIRGYLKEEDKLFEYALLELKPISKLGLKVDLLKLLDKSELLEKIKLLKEIAILLSEKLNSGVKLIEKEKSVTYVTYTCGCVDGVELKEVAYLIGTLLDKDFTVKEIYTLLYKLKEDRKIIIPDEDAFKYEYLLKYLYPNYKGLDNISDNFEFKHYILSNKKNKFLKTLYEMGDYKFNGTLFNESVYKKLNLNNLTPREIKSIDSMISLRHYSSLELERYTNIEYGEFVKMTNLTLSQARLFNRLKFDTLSEKLEMLDNFCGGVKITDITNKHDISEDKLIKLLKEKSLKERVYELINPQSVDYSKISSTKWIELILLDCSDDLKKQVKNSSDIDFLTKMSSQIKGSPIQDLNLLKRSLFEKSDTYIDFCKKLELSSDFIKENFELIYNFYDKGYIDIYNDYLVGISSSAIIRNFNNITKSEILGKLDQVKFYPGDLSLEVDMEIDNELEEKWKENISVNIDGYNIVEDYSYETCMKIGENPVSTCLSYIDGAYKSCLLSSFDASKKLLTMKDADGKITSRAYLRLTKMSDSYIHSGQSGLLFRDITEEVSASDVSKNDEELVLFLEKNYTYLNEIDSVTDAMVKAAYEKAKAMGVKLVVAGYYKQKRVSEIFKDELEVCDNKYIYIAKSKHSKQYLDSFFGELSSGAEKYIKVNNCMVIV